MATEASTLGLPFLRARRPPEERIALGLRRAGRVAWLMDESIRIPIVGYRIGLDSVIGLVPGLGDLIGLLFSLYPIVEAVNLRAPRQLVAKMVRNVVLDFLVGLIPIFGDMLDAMMKVNKRNMALLRDHFARPPEPPPGRWFGLFRR